MKLLNKLFPLLVLIVLLIGFLLRGMAFLRGDFFFFQDQSRDLLLVKDFVENGNLMLIGSRTGFGGLFHGPLWIYSLVPTFILSSGNPFWTLIPVDVFYSMGIIIAGLIAGWKLYGRWIGLIFSFFLAISSPLIASIYYMTDAHVTPLIFIGFLYSIVSFIRGGQKYFVVSMFFVGLAFQFEPAFAIIFLPITLMSLIVVRKISIKIIIAGLIALIISVSNFILFDLRHKFIMTNAFLKLIAGKQMALPGYENFQRLDFRVLDRLSSALSSFLTTLYSKEPFSIFLIILIAIFTFYYLLRGKRDKEFKEIIFLFLFPFIAYFFYILYPYPLWDHYVLPIVITASLFLALSIRKISQTFLGLLISVIFIIAAIVPVTNTLAVSYSHFSRANIDSDSSYQNQLSVAKWILQDAGSEQFNYLVYNPSTFTYGMDYLFSWRKLIDNSKPTACAKNGLTYLIFYPYQQGDSGAYSFWKKNIVKTNVKPLLSKQFFGNLTVEKLNIKDDTEQIDSNYCQKLLFR